MEKPLHLTLSGVCIEKVPYKDVSKLDAIQSLLVKISTCIHVYGVLFCWYICVFTMHALVQVVHFATTVRSKETRHLTIHNKSHSQWLLKPIIDGEHWHGSETLSVGPTQSKHYELTYHPLRMTTDTQKHHGSVFFPLPDGTGLLYQLQGTAEPPKHTGAISQV